jgi:hypothetical protein
MHRNDRTAAAFGRAVFAFIFAGGLAGIAPEARAQSGESLPAAAIISSVVAQHSIAQQGLSIGLAAALVKGQLAVLEAPTKVNKCVRVDGGGSVKTLQEVRNGTTSHGTVELYYDNTCQDRYINARVIGHKRSASLLTGAVTATVYRVSGQAVGKLVLSERVIVDAATINVSATGTFTPGGSGPVDVGFNCKIPDLQVSGPTGKDVCHVGIAQTLSAAGGDLASVTPITVSVSDSTPKATFIANNAQMVAGTAGTLGIEAPTMHSLTVTGSQAQVGTAAGHGTFATFSMFQKGPTSWVSTDTGNNVRFTMSLAKGAKIMKGTIKALGNNATLATISIDIAGNGSITYSNNKTAVIKSWVITG